MKTPLFNAIAIACYNTDMTVREYYTTHFNELSAKKQFHFATRIKNWFKTDQFDHFLANHELNRNLASVLANDDFSRVNYYAERKEYFEKYAGLYATEATLFNVLHLLQEYNIDLRDEFLELYGGREKLYALADALRSDGAAFFTLSSFAVNVIALTEEFFPRQIDVYAEMLEKALNVEQNEKSIYLYTHILLCESRFYHREILQHQELYLRALNNCDRIIAEKYDDISLDIKFEFLVCTKMLNYHSENEDKIRIEAQNNKANFVRDPRKPDRLNTFDGAEHRNVLYIMSGLDVE